MIQILAKTSDGIVQTIDRLQKKGTKKQKEEYENGETIVFEATTRKNKYHSKEFPKEHYGTFRG